MSVPKVRFKVTAAEKGDKMVRDVPGGKQKKKERRCVVRAHTMWDGKRWQRNMEATSRCEVGPRTGAGSPRCEADDAAALVVPSLAGKPRGTY
jgi:hypothetical protein